MDMYCGAAARAAAARAASCRERRAELNNRRAVAHGDVERANEFLDRATERATIAQHRLTQVRSRVQARALIGSSMLQDVEGTNSAALRSRLAPLPLQELYLSYQSIGGSYGDLELEAFVHAALDWSAQEQQILAHAAWEITEFSE